LCEHHDLVLDLKATEVSALCSSEQKLLRGLAESEAAVISHECSSVNQLGLALPVGGIQGPKVKLLGTAHGELVLRGVTELDVFLVTTPLDALGGFSVHSGEKLKLSNNKAVSSVPNKQFSIEL
jgi:hypothetical protein